jgi:hypothetical protein
MMCEEILFVAGELRERSVSAGKPCSRSPFEFCYCLIGVRRFHRTLSVLPIGASWRTMI